MLTDRQERFYNVIESLELNSSSVSYLERVYLEYVAKDIYQDNTKFKAAINFLIWHLKEIEKSQDNGLTQEVKALFEDLKATYGEPDSEPREILKGKEWYEINPEYNFAGFGTSAQGGWGKITPDRKPPMRDHLFTWFRSFLVLLFIFIFWKSPLPSLLIDRFGDKGKAFSLAIILIILVIELSFSGRFRRKK